MTGLSCAAQWLRQRGTITLWVVGLSLLGWVLAANLNSRIYQARQERAYFLLLNDMNRDSGTEAGGDPLVLGRIEIPRIGVVAMVREGDDPSAPVIAVGHVAGSARPGEGGNMVLAGRRDSFARAVREIRPADTIRIVTPQRPYEYIVDSTEVVILEDTRVLAPTDSPVLTLMTDFPFASVGNSPTRFIVRASLVEVLPAAAGGGEKRRRSAKLSLSEETQ